ncbi:hypothetical protein ACHAWF_006027 [Thalassiosira exigua]
MSALLPFPRALFLLLGIAPSLGLGAPPSPSAAEAKGAPPLSDRESHHLRRALQDAPAPAPCRYYTTWSQVFGQVCVNDCNSDEWDNTYDTLEECCQAHHGFSGPGGLNDCLGITEGPTDVATGSPTGSPTPGPSKAPAPCLYYTNWGQTFGQICVNDCQNDGGEVFQTMEACCQAKHGYAGPGGLNDCLGVTESPTGTVTIAPTGSPTPGPSKAPAPCLYYTKWGQTPGQMCVNDCQNDGGEVFQTMEACCQAKHGFAGPGGLNDCLGVTESPTGTVTVAVRVIGLYPSSFLENSL